MRKGKEDNITEILKLIAPGTPIRDGLENILRARTGALLLITDNNDVLKQVVDGGFTINEEYSSSKLYELAKEKGTPYIKDASEKVREKAIEVTKEVLKKLEKKDK